MNIPDPWVLGLSARHYRFEVESLRRLKKLGDENLSYIWHLFFVLFLRPAVFPCLNLTLWANSKGLPSQNPSGLQSSPRAQVHLATPSACPQIVPLCKNKGHPSSSSVDFKGAAKSVPSVTNVSNLPRIPAVKTLCSPMHTAVESANWTVISVLIFARGNTNGQKGGEQFRLFEHNI